MGHTSAGHIIDNNGSRAGKDEAESPDTFGDQFFHERCHSAGCNFFPVPSSSRLIAFVGQILAARRILSSASPCGSMASAIIFASSLKTLGAAWIHLA